MAEEQVLGFFTEFSWAVPEAFAAAVCSYRFEQGDVLHRERRGYEQLSGRIPKGLTAIQLRQPPRSARAVPSEFEGDRRLANWQGEVELELVDLASGASASRTTTQGRLFMVLWKGDEGWLAADRAEPALPRSARELGQVLREGQIRMPAPRGVRTGCRFSFVVDLSSDASRVKASTVGDALHALGPSEVRELRPDELGVPDADRFHPTLVLREVVLRGVDVAAAEAALKRALYAGTGESERFQIARHGLLEPLPDLEKANLEKAGVEKG